jgi:hypothetical protein
MPGQSPSFSLIGLSRPAEDLNQWGDSFQCNKDFGACPKKSAIKFIIKMNPIRKNWEYTYTV